MNPRVIEFSELTMIYLVIFLDSDNFEFGAFFSPNKSAERIPVANYVTRFSSMS